MAENLYPQTFPFMSKETFDQVSAVMWGPNDYDYHTHYITSRTEWYDEDLREETMYATGLAYGLQIAALERTNQPISHQNGYQDQPSALSDEGCYQFGCTSQCDPRYGRHYCYTPHVPQPLAQTPPSQPPRPVLSFSELARTPSESAALHRQASIVNDRSAPRQDSGDYSYGNFGTERPYAKTSSSSSQLSPLGMATHPSYMLPRETEVPGTKLSGNLKAVYRPGQGVVAVSGSPTSPDGRMVHQTPSDSAAFHFGAEMPLRQKPHSPAAAHNDKAVGDTAVSDNEDWVDLGTN